MANFEEENVGGRSWQLMGEATAKTRPENSLLEEHVGFDHTTKARKFAFDCLKFNVKRF